MDYRLSNLADVIRKWGRGVVFYAHNTPAYDPAADAPPPGVRWTPGLGNPLYLAHLGDTEGDIAVTPNAEVAMLTLPEHSGPAVHDAEYTGENPVIEFPLFLADPALLALVSPVGSAHAGASIRESVAEHTIVIFPEPLFVKRVSGKSLRKALSFSGGVWQLDGQALDAAQQTLLGVSFWLWRCFFNRPPRHFKGGHGNDSRAIETVSVQGMHHPDMSEGAMLYSTGDPADLDIDLEGGS
jgi:hypothetical protein